MGWSAWSGVGVYGGQDGCQSKGQVAEMMPVLEVSGSEELPNLSCLHGQGHGHGYGYGHGMEAGSGWLTGRQPVPR